MGAVTVGERFLEEKGLHPMREGKSPKSLTIAAEMQRVSAIYFLGP